MFVKIHLEDWHYNKYQVIEIQKMRSDYAVLIIDALKFEQQIYLKN